MARSAAALATAPAATAAPTALHPDRRAWDREVRGYQDHLVLGSKSPRTISTYLGALAAWARWRTDEGLSLAPEAATRAEAKAWGAYLVGSLSTATARGYLLGVSGFYTYMVAEWAAVDEVRRSPFAGIALPVPAKVRVPVLAHGEVDALLAACAGTTFDALRDRAVLALLVTSGLRRSEAAALRVEDLAEDLTFVTVHQGKGRRDRLAPIAPVAAEALRRYLRRRDRHADAALGALFLVTPGHGHRGAMSAHGLATMLARRSEAAGLGRVHLHQLRHTWTHEGLANGVPEGAMVVMAGWTSRTMLDRYGADLAQERALANYPDPLARGRRGR